MYNPGIYVVLPFLRVIGKFKIWTNGKGKNRKFIVYKKTGKPGK